MAEHHHPSAVVVLARLDGLRILLPSAVLEIDSRALALRGEPHLYIGGHLPAWRAPGERDQRRRIVRGDAPDVVFGAVGAAFVEAAAELKLKARNAVLAAEAARPPFAHLLAERLERAARRARDPDRFAYRHRNICNLGVTYLSSRKIRARDGENPGAD